MNSSGSAGATPTSAISRPASTLVAGHQRCRRSARRTPRSSVAPAKASPAYSSRRYARSSAPQLRRAASPLRLEDHPLHLALERARDHRHQPPDAQLPARRVAGQRARRGQPDAVAITQEDVDAERVQRRVPRGGHVVGDVHDEHRELVRRPVAARRSASSRRAMMPAATADGVSRTCDAGRPAATTSQPRVVGGRVGGVEARPPAFDRALPEPRRDVQQRPRRAAARRPPRAAAGAGRSA